MTVASSWPAAPGTRKPPRLAGLSLEPERGFEPLTLALQERCSGQLSYSGVSPSLGRAQASATETAASSDPCPFDEYGIGGGSSPLRAVVNAPRAPPPPTNNPGRPAA